MKARWRTVPTQPRSRYEVNGWCRIPHYMLRMR
jgi:hypothetical protein